MSAHAIDVSTSDFQSRVIDASRKQPVLVDFWAPWCGPCRTLGPILERLAAEYRGRFLLAKVNSDENQELAYQFGVRGIPNVKAIVDGQLVDEFVGVLPEPAIREFIERLLPSPAEPLREQAAAARARGEPDAARRLLLEAMRLDPRHEAARLDLVGLLLDARETADARRLLDELGDDLRDAPRAEALRSRLALLEQAPAGADLSALRARIDANPADLDARLELANLLALERQYRPALEQLLEIVRRDRAFRDDIGRKTMIQLFNLIGSDDDLVREFRGELAAALNR